MHIAYPFCVYDTIHFHASQVDALSLYHNLMREAPAPQYYGAFPGAVPPPGAVGGPPGGQPMGGYMPMPAGPPPPQHMGHPGGPPPQHMPPQNGGAPPTYYQAVDPSLYPGYQGGPPGMMPGEKNCLCLKQPGVDKKKIFTPGNHASIVSNCFQAQHHHPPLPCRRNLKCDLVI